ELARELRRGAEAVGARREGEAAEVDAGFVVARGDRLFRGDVVGGRQGGLGLGGDGVVAGGRAVDDGGGAEAGERGARRDAEVTVEDRRAGVSDALAAEE